MTPPDRQYLQTFGVSRPRDLRELWGHHHEVSREYYYYKFPGSDIYFASTVRTYFSAPIRLFTEPVTMDRET